MTVVPEEVAITAFNVEATVRVCVPVAQRATGTELLNVVLVKELELPNKQSSPPLVLEVIVIVPPEDVNAPLTARKVLPDKEIVPLVMENGPPTFS